MKDRHTPPEYWLSLDELNGSAEFTREIHGVPEGIGSDASRREFMRLMSASLALAGMTGCRWPKEKIAPYAGRPRGRTPGVPEYYATAMELGGYATGLLVTSADGRPIKVDGNPLDPISRGASTSIAQASVLELYDPDRSRSLVRREANQEFRPGWDQFRTFSRWHFGKILQRKGLGLFVLSESSSSPSRSAMRSRFREVFPEAAWHEYEPVSRDNERSGAALAFGRPVRTMWRLDLARTVVVLDEDLFMTHPAALKYAREIAEHRTADAESVPRLYVVESTFTVTGAAADHRLALRRGDIARFAAALAVEIANHETISIPTALQPLFDTLRELPDHPFDHEFIGAVARELVLHRGEGVLLSGPSQSPEVHALVHILNEVLGNAGKTVAYLSDPVPDRPTHAESIKAVAGAMRDGSVDTLLILGGNPVYDAPADLDFGDHLAKVSTSLHLSLYRNETSMACAWHVPRSHQLESWGDARAFEGTLYTVQPLIAPLYDGKTVAEVLGILLDEPVIDSYSITRRTMKPMAAEDGFEAFWEATLHRGLLENSSFPEVNPDVQPASLLREKRDFLAALSGSKQEAVEVCFHPDNRVYDGRFANNGWLQEQPDPMTKLTWDNAALIAPETASRLKVETGDVVSLRRSNRELSIAALVMPGQAPGSVTVALGYGREAAGRVGNHVGRNAYQIRTTGGLFSLGGFSITRTGETHPLATTQDHHSIRHSQQKSKQTRIENLVREIVLSQEKYNRLAPSSRGAKRRRDLLPLPQGEGGGEGSQAPPLWKQHQYQGHRWGMAIDLNRCIGCGSCILACQAENNIPVVGKEQVANGREMHWIRVDRYFKGEPDGPRAVHQPITCVHCENAPCEQVCPVAATVHSEEGLNQMVYNRCVGTRYCSNNCPFKVRRFNFFNYRKNLPEIEKMLFNPEVTVRSRGVMEKCTFCVQRIQKVKIRAGIERRPIEDGEIVPACAQACPTRAIVFGDLNHPNSKVARLHQSDRAYELLPLLNLRSRTLYLARIRNPNPELTKGTDDRKRDA